MPHITIKLFPGATEEQKQELSDKIVQDAMEILGKGEGSFSVDIEDIPKEDWFEKVYDVEISPKMDKLYKKPGYKKPE